MAAANNLRVVAFGSLLYVGGELMKRTIHDGSRSYSIEVPNPEPGEGKHAKTEGQKIRRHSANELLEFNRRFQRPIKKLIILKGE